MKTDCGRSREGNDHFLSCPEALKEAGDSSPATRLLQELCSPENCNSNSNCSNSDRASESNSDRDDGARSSDSNNSDGGRGDSGRRKDSHSNTSSKDNSSSINVCFDSDSDSNSNNNYNKTNNNNNDTNKKHSEIRAKRDSNGNSSLVSNYNKQNQQSKNSSNLSSRCASAMCKSDECCYQNHSCECDASASRFRECKDGCAGAKKNSQLCANRNTVNNNRDESDIVAKRSTAFSSNGCATGVHNDAVGSSGHVRHRGGTAKVLNSGRSISPRLKELLQGLNEPGDSGNAPVPPDWLDRRLFNRGRQFYGRFLFCIFFSDLLALLMMFTVSRILRPLIYTGRSDTPLRAVRRYVSTILHVVAWYSGDVWDPEDPAHRDVLSVRAIHDKSARSFNSSTDHEKVSVADVRDRGHEEPRCPFSPAVRNDLRHQAEQGLVLETPEDPPLYISQWDMLVTQYSFLGVLVAHPWRVGAWWASEEDLAGLIHFWRGIGWLLGVEDKYNFCNGNIADTRALCLEMERFLIIPGFAAADWNHEHMSTSLVTGINHMIPFLSYPAMLRFLSDTLGMSLPSFVGQMSLRHTFQYWLMRFVFHVLFLIPGVIYLFNELLLLSLRIIQDKNPTWKLKSEKYNVRGFPHVYT